MVTNLGINSRFITVMSKVIYVHTDVRASQKQIGKKRQTSAFVGWNINLDKFGMRLMRVEVGTEFCQRKKALVWKISVGTCKMDTPAQM